MIVDAWLFSTKSCRLSSRLGYPTDAVSLAEPLEAGLSAGHNFVDVRLVTGVPQDCVVWRFKDPVQCKCQFDRAEVRAEMARVRRNRMNDEVTNFTRQLIELRVRQ